MLATYLDHEDARETTISGDTWSYWSLKLSDTYGGTVTDAECALQHFQLTLHCPPFSTQFPAWPDHTEPLPSIRENIASLRPIVLMIGSK